MTLSPGTVVRHFKGGFYEIVACAVHTETGEEFVVYRALATGIVYARPKDMFLSSVDREKYPEAGQEKRFEAVPGGS